MRTSCLNRLRLRSTRSRVTLFTRHEEVWEEREVYGLGESIHLPSVETTLALSDIYALIELKGEAAV